MFENNKDLYPTPQNLINRMLLGLDLDMINSILEPSTGNGNIVDALKQKEESLNNSTYYRRRYLDIDCIEIDPNMQHILKGKGYKVVYNDFLTYDTMKEYDLIIMNPPFSNGCKHLLKALEMQKRNGGCIICLLNAETLKNAYTNERMDLQRKLTEYGAQVEFIQNAFLGAERKTDVEIALIRVSLPKVERESFIFSTLKKAQEVKDIDSQSNDAQIADRDLFKAITAQYNMEVNAGIKLIKEFKAMEPYIMSEFSKDKETGKTVQSGSCILSLDLSSNKDKYSNKLSINDYIREVRGKYWKALFQNPKFIGQLTDNLQREFYNKLDELKNYDFSLYNIYQLKIDMQKNVVSGIEDAIIALFDELSDKYHWLDEGSKNIHYYNGWKTNKAWIINKKVIIPLKAFSDWSGRFETRYDVKSKLQDIEKCFNYLDGGLTEAIDLEKALQAAEDEQETKNIQLKYFSVTFYKKGTCHITFKNEELLKKFNIFGSQHKGWLPPAYGKKKYQDMTQEEKAVVNDFEGEQEYNKVMLNKDYYLFDGNNLNLLENQSA